MLNFFSDYPEGYDLTMVQTSFIKARKNERGKWLPSVLTMVARDNNTGKKILDHIEDPIYPFYYSLCLLDQGGNWSNETFDEFQK